MTGCGDGKKFFSSLEKNSLYDLEKSFYFHCLGIGRELTKQLISNGARVIGVSRTQENLNELTKELEGKPFQAIQLDLSDWKVTKDVLGKLDVKLDGIVNNAGVAIIKPFEQMTESDFDKVMNVNFKACFNVIQTLLPNLEIGASIVNISSLAGLKAFDGHSVYSASKASLDSLTRSLALELAPKAIRVNSINPTVILTKMGKTR